jgi:ATP adenylyltransferase
MSYLESLHGDDGADSPPTSEPDKKAKKPESSGSFLLDYWRTPDDDAHNHVVLRNEHGMILLNKYPYSNGHLLIALGEARPTLSDYDPDQRAQLWQLVDRAVALCEKALEPQGLNIGINQGIAGGAGVPSHLHVHVMPRWVGDTNFITAVGGVRVIPSALELMYERYAKTAQSMTQGS